MQAKAQTANGKQIAKFTLLCEFKPVYQRPNKDTGEIFERWTYRSDKENLKYATAHDGNLFQREIDVLGFIFNRDAHKYQRARLFDNRKETGQQLLAEWVNGKLHYPYANDVARRIKLVNWLKNIL